MRFAELRNLLAAISQRVKVRWISHHSARLADSSTLIPRSLAAVRIIFMSCAPGRLSSFPVNSSRSPRTAGRFGFRRAVEAGLDLDTPRLEGFPPLFRKYTNYAVRVHWFCPFLLILELVRMQAPSNGIDTQARSPLFDPAALTPLHNFKPSALPTFW